jgi:putative restriction endonuclease
MSSVIRTERVSFYHDANLSRFPKRDNGSGLIHYGIAFSFLTTAALREFVTALQDALALTSPLAPEKTLSEEVQEIETEAEVVAKARRGQGRFRADLLNYWQGHCALTGVSAPELLRASHIKPWRDSKGAERLDAFNGLLLAVHLDALFDRGLISFQDSGDMLVSKRLSSKDREVFGLMPRVRKLLLSVPHLAYLRHHQDRFQVSEQKF